MDICWVLLLTDIRTSAKAYRAVVESEKKRAHVNVETLSFASEDIANSSTPCCSFERHFHFRLIVGVHSLHGSMRLLASCREGYPSCGIFMSDRDGRDTVIYGCLQSG
jgi:hypothetical protein